MYFLEAKNPCFVTKDCSKSSYICVFILSKKQHNWFYKNLHNLRMVGRRKLPDPSLNCIFNALSIGVQYTLSFQWTDFGLKCLHVDQNEKLVMYSVTHILTRGGYSGMITGYTTMAIKSNSMIYEKMFPQVHFECKCLRCWRKVWLTTHRKRSIS